MGSQRSIELSTVFKSCTKLALFSLSYHTDDGNWLHRPCLYSHLRESCCAQSLLQSLSHPMGILTNDTLPTRLYGKGNQPARFEYATQFA
jgi:hypothetical protein